MTGLLLAAVRLYWYYRDPAPEPPPGLPAKSFAFNRTILVFLYLTFAIVAMGVLAGLGCLLALVNAPDDAVPELLRGGLERLAVDVHSARVIRNSGPGGRGQLHRGKEHVHIIGKMSVLDAGVATLDPGFVTH